MDTKPNPPTTPSPAAHPGPVIYRCRVCDHAMTRGEIDKATTVLCPSCGVTDLTEFECVPFRRPTVGFLWGSDGTNP